MNHEKHEKHEKMGEGLVPRLRFPEFWDNGEWKKKKLVMLTEPVTDRVGDLDCVPYTVTSGEGLISQVEKYGRTIAGKSLKNYYRLKRDDFAFNKSATKSFPQGYIARFQENERAAVPNSIFTCFRIADANIDATYLDYLFQGNLHGRWLKDYITVGARAHGALNISDNDLYALPIPLPAGDDIKAEQQKIADCLGSLDGLIAAEGRKLAALRDHKRGLMQQLFPQPSQTQPRLRFPDFRDKGEWMEKRAGSLFSQRKEKGQKGLPIYSVTINDGMVLRSTFDRNFYDIEEPAGNKKVCKNDIAYNMMRMWQGACGTAPEDCMVSPAYVVLKPKKGTFPAFFDVLFKRPAILHLLMAYSRGLTLDRLRLYFDDFTSLPLLVPAESEQQKIADFLGSLDTQITAQAAKIEALKKHKRGLMQQLFPAPEVS